MEFVKMGVIGVTVAYEYKFSNLFLVEHLA